MNPVKEWLVFFPGIGVEQFWYSSPELLQTIGSPGSFKMENHNATLENHDR